MHLKSVFSQAHSHILPYKLLFLKVILQVMPITAFLCALSRSPCYLSDPVCLSRLLAGLQLVVTISINAIQTVPVSL